MTDHVIQFSRLEQFVQEELGQSGPVRVIVLDITESASSQVPGLRTAAVGVHVRAINDQGHILACYLPVARLQLYNGRRAGDPTWEQYDLAWEKAEALKERVIAYLQEAAADNNGFTVCAAGVIDLGQARPLGATWSSDPALKKTH
jgi:hypothetical protein